MGGILRDKAAPRANHRHPARTAAVHAADAHGPARIRSSAARREIPTSAAGEAPVRPRTVRRRRRNGS